MMNTQELAKKLYQIQELKRLSEEINAELESLTDEVKAVMTEQDTEEMTVDIFKVRWTKVKTSRIDTAALKKEMPEVAQQYTKTTESRRFSVT